MNFLIDVTKSEIFTLNYREKRDINNFYNHDNPYDNNLVKEDSLLFVNELKTKNDLFSNCEENGQILTIQKYRKNNSLKNKLQLKNLKN